VKVILETDRLLLREYVQDDRNVPFQQTTDLVEKLRAQNVAFEELIIPDEIHDLLRCSGWVRAYRATAEFFDRRLAAATPRQ
jgi:dipeptidyl aminopeptidase/acylaminoacyl peptidase